MNTTARINDTWYIKIAESTDDNSSCNNKKRLILIKNVKLRK